MPPKVNRAKDDILAAAVEIVRESGTHALNARTVAAKLGCSTQPVFSNFSSMQELRLAVVARADQLCREYMEQEVRSGVYPAYKATGMAYIRFAKEEKELFRLLYMRDRSDEDSPADLEIGSELEQVIQNGTGLDVTAAKRFHLEMWACVHGIAVMFATGFVDLPWELVSDMLTDIFLGLKKQYGTE